MFKPNLRLFLSLLVAGSVSSLKCLQMDASKCNRNGDRTHFFRCLNATVKSVNCEAPKVCLQDGIRDRSNNIVILKGCSLAGDCNEGLEKKMLGDKIARELAAQACTSCTKDNCLANIIINENSAIAAGEGPLDDPSDDLSDDPSDDLSDDPSDSRSDARSDAPSNVPSVAPSDASSAIPKKSGGGGSRSHHRMTMQKMSILVLIVLFSYF